MKTGYREGRPGWKHTEEAKRKIGLSKKGKPLHPATLEAIHESRKRPVMIISEATGEILHGFETRQEAADFAGRTTVTIIRYIQERKKIKGMIFMNGASQI